MKIGYARVSTEDQNLDLQTQALLAAGCERIYTEKMSGKGSLFKDRQELHRLLEDVRSGDTLVVWRLDRIGRSLKYLIDTVEFLHEKRVEFVSLMEHIDTSTPTGRLTFNIFGAFAEFERDLIRERTRAGLSAARARGHSGGRQRVIPQKKIDYALYLYRQRDKTVSQICEEVGISRASFYFYSKGQHQDQRSQEQ